jgi:hypothetical protein
MPFTKRIKKHPASGMKPGQKSAKVEAWERIGEYLINEGSERYLRIISGLPDDRFIKEFQAIIEFFRPRLQRAEVQQETTVNYLRPPKKHIFIGYTDEEELKIRREEEAKPIEYNAPPGKVHINYQDAEESMMPKIHIRRDNE